MQFGSLPGKGKEEVRRSQVKKREDEKRALLFSSGFGHTERGKEKGSQALTCSFTSPYFFSIFSLEAKEKKERKKGGLVAGFFVRGGHSLLLLFLRRRRMDVLPLCVGWEKREEANRGKIHKVRRGKRRGALRCEHSFLQMAPIYSITAAVSVALPFSSY